MNKPERPDPVFGIKFESDDPEEQKKEIEETSELRNYTSVVNEVKYSSRVYLAKNGAGSDNYDRYERI